jgi:RNA polymerase sigma-70 factor (ECF subfamily)
MIMREILFLPRSDEYLVREGLRDAPGAFEALVRRYQRKAHAIALAAGAAPSWVEDAVQEAFLLAFRDLPQLRSHASFGPWFLSIVRNVVRKMHRSAQHQTVVEDLDRIQAPNRGSIEKRDFAESVWGQVLELPP